MLVMARGTLNPDEDYHMDTLLDAQFGKAGGSKFNTDDFYWSSTDSDIKCYCIRFSDNSKPVDEKKNEHYVRAVLAF